MDIMDVKRKMVLVYSVLILPRYHMDSFPH
jgi:hypothetical protein